MPTQQSLVRNGSPPTPAAAVSDNRDFLSTNLRKYSADVLGGPEHASYTANEPPEQTLYRGRPLIGPGTRINGGVSFGDGARAAVVIDFNTDERLTKAYNEFAASLRAQRPDGAFRLGDVVSSLTDFCATRLGGRPANLPKLVDTFLDNNKINDGRKVAAGVFLHAGIGGHDVRAVVVGAFLERMIDQEILGGVVEVRRNRAADGTRVVAVFTDTNGVKTHIDPSLGGLAPQTEMAHGSRDTETSMLERTFPRGLTPPPLLDSALGTQLALFEATLNKKGEFVATNQAVGKETGREPPQWLFKLEVIVTDLKRELAELKATATANPGHIDKLRDFLDGVSGKDLKKITLTPEQLARAEAAYDAFAAALN